MINALRGWAGRHSRACWRAEDSPTRGSLERVNRQWDVNLGGDAYASVGGYVVGGCRVDNVDRGLATFVRGSQIVGLALE